ncbi:hypothetical protein HQ520_02860 [bacterium]|nr:hypothetical protein [bacterium]
MENQTSISLLLADVQGTLQTLDQTLVHSDTLTSNVNTTLRVARPTLQDATAASEAAARAADNGRALVDSIGVLLRQIEESGDDEPTSPSQPFNILDYKRAAEAIAGGAAEVAVVLEQVLTLIEMGQTGDEPSADEESSFDILDYAETARALESASKEVQVLLSQAQEFAREPADPGVSAGDTVLGRTLAYSSEQIRELINAAVIRLALLVLLIFVLAVVYLCIKRAITQTRK